MYSFIPFMFDGGIIDGKQLFICNGKSLKLTDEDYKNWDENGIDEDSIKTLSYSYMTNMVFEDFASSSSNKNNISTTVGVI